MRPSTLIWTFILFSFVNCAEHADWPLLVDFLLSRLMASCDAQRALSDDGRWLVNEIDVLQLVSQVDTPTFGGVSGEHIYIERRKEAAKATL